MIREKIYKEMEHEKIIMSERFRRRLDQTGIAELTARWTGVLDLVEEHQPRVRRAEWMARILWNSTALTVGKEIMENDLRRRQRAAEETEKKRREEAMEKEWSERKLAFWHSWSPEEKRQIIASYSNSIGGCFQEYVEKNCLDRLDSMADRSVLLFFWNAIPPFAIIQKTEEKVPLAA